MDNHTEKLVRSLLSKYKKQLKKKRIELMLDPSEAVILIKEDLKVKHQIEVPNLTIKILRILAEEEFNE
jgi:hypothetical protein